VLRLWVQVSKKNATPFQPWPASLSNKPRQIVGQRMSADGNAACASSYRRFQALPQDVREHLAADRDQCYPSVIAFRAAECLQRFEKRFNSDSWDQAVGMTSPVHSQLNSCKSTVGDDINSGDINSVRIHLDTNACGTEFAARAARHQPR
jgi:hypothetical protein